jgi:hypothetical protein
MKSNGIRIKSNDKLQSSRVFLLSLSLSLLSFLLSFFQIFSHSPPCLHPCLHLSSLFFHSSFFIVFFSFHNTFLFISIFHSIVLYCTFSSFVHCYLSSLVFLSSSLVFLTRQTTMTMTNDNDNDNDNDTIYNKQ